MKLQRTLSADDLDDVARKGGPWTVRTESVEGCEVVCEFSNVPVVDVSECLGDAFVEPIGSYCQEQL